LYGDGVTLIRHDHRCGPMLPCGEKGQE
jgi:hypothetical protein